MCLCLLFTARICFQVTFPRHGWFGVLFCASVGGLMVKSTYIYVLVGHRRRRVVRLSTNKHKRTANQTETTTTAPGHYLAAIQSNAQQNTRQKHHTLGRMGESMFTVGQMHMDWLWEYQRVVADDYIP